MAIEIQPVGYCRGCGGLRPLVGVTVWPGSITEVLGEVLSTGQCAACGSTVSVSPESPKAKEV